VKKFLIQDKRFMRPAEVDVLVGLGKKAEGALKQNLKNW